MTSWYLMVSYVHTEVDSSKREREKRGEEWIWLDQG